MSPDVGFEVYFQIVVEDEVLFRFVAAGEGEEFTLFKAYVYVWSALQADANLPMIRPTRVNVLQVVEVPGLKQHEFFEVYLVEGEIGVDHFHCLAGGDDWAELGG